MSDTITRRKKPPTSADEFIDDASIKSNTESPINLKAKRKFQTRKVIHLDEQLENAFLDFQTYNRKECKKKISFQSFVEGLLRRELKDFLD